jgi:hypothetical protein
MSIYDNPSQQLTSALNASCNCVAANVHALRQRIESTYTHGPLEMRQTHPHLFSMQPYFVAGADAERMQSIISTIERVTALPDYQAAVFERAPAIARHDQGTKGVFFGYDFHLTPTGPKLIEINTNAGGALLNVQLLREQLGCCGDAPLFASHRNHAVVERQMLAMFESEWRRTRGNQPLRSIVILDEAPSGQYLYPEFLLFKELFEAQGLSVSIADPGELEFDGRVLRHEGRNVDLVYNRHTDFYFETPALAALRSAYLANAAIVTPHPRAHALYADKRNLILLSDTNTLRELELDDATIETLTQGIPQTMSVKPSDGTRWWAQRKEWFFKPTRSYGSRGVYRGDKLTKRAFTSILEGDYVAQRLAHPSERGNAHGSPFKVDVRNYVYDGSVQLIATRLYQGQTTNFRTEGGGFAPVFFIPSNLDEVRVSGCSSDPLTRTPTPMLEASGTA